MNFKKLVMIGTAVLVVCCTIAGCSSEKNNPENQDAKNKEQQENVQNNNEKDAQLQEAINKGVLITEYIRDEKYSEAVSCFGGALKESIDQQELEETIQKVLFGIGEYKGISEEKHAERFDGYTVVTVTLVYENNGLTLKYTFDDEMVVQGFFCNYSGKRYDNSQSIKSDKYKEIKLILGEHRLEGILTLPLFVSNPDCVVLVQGSGPCDMDETIGAASSKPFYDIAHALSENGIATIRFNKRFYEHPHLATDDTTITDEVLEDVNAALSFAKETGYVNSERIFVLGHSMGGMLAPKIAADNNFVAGVIIMAGSPRYLADIMYDQNADLINTDKNITDEEKSLALAQLDRQRQMANNASSDGKEKPFGITEKYWHSLNEATNREILINTNKPLLIIQGSADFQVKAEKDYEEYKTLLKEKKNVSFRLYEGLNHIFMKTNGKTDITEYNVKGTVNEIVLSDIIDFVANAKAHVHNNGEQDSLKDNNNQSPETSENPQNTQITQNPEDKTGQQQGQGVDYSNGQAEDDFTIVDASGINKDFFN